MNYETQCIFCMKYHAFQIRDRKQVKLGFPTSLWIRLCISKLALLIIAEREPKVTKLCPLYRTKAQKLINYEDTESLHKKYLWIYYLTQKCCTWVHTFLTYFVRTPSFLFQQTTWIRNHPMYIILYLFWSKFLLVEIVPYLLMIVLNCLIWRRVKNLIKMRTQVGIEAGESVQKGNIISVFAEDMVYL